MRRIVSFYRLKFMKRFAIYSSWRYLLKVKRRNTILKTHRIRRNGSSVFTGRGTMLHTLEYPRPCTMSRCTHQGNSIAFHPHSLASPASRLGGGYRAPRKQSSRRERGGGKEIESITQSKVWKRAVWAAMAELQQTPPCPPFRF